MCERGGGGLGCWVPDVHTALLRAFPAGAELCPGSLSLFSAPPPLSAITKLVVRGQRKDGRMG